MTRPECRHGNAVQEIINSNSSFFFFLMRSNSQSLSSRLTYPKCWIISNVNHENNKYKTSITFDSSLCHGNRVPFWTGHTHDHTVRTLSGLARCLVSSVSDRLVVCFLSQITAVCREAALQALQEDITAQSIVAGHFHRALQAVTPRVPDALIQSYVNYQQQRGLRLFWCPWGRRPTCRERSGRSGDVSLCYCGHQPRNGTVVIGRRFFSFVAF